MSLPDMTNWSEEAKQKAFNALEERDKLYGWDKENNDLAYVGKVDSYGHVYDEEDLSRDSQGL